MKSMILAAALALSVTPAAALAGVLPDGGVTSAEVAKALQDKGYRAEVTTGSDGDPLIKSAADGTNFRILFYSCSKAQRCASIQFVAAFDLDDGLKLSRINAWNSSKRFGRAYLDDDMDPFVEMDVDFEHGATSEAIANNVDTWAAVLPAFKTFIDEK
jgi:hypothetical protein